MSSAIWAILIFCVLIFVHEFGHFITAKLSKMTVHEFSVGMGPKLFSTRKNDTTYSIRLLPIGGYVKLEGEDGESSDNNAFCNKSAAKRFLVLIAGAFMNILLGFLVFVIVYSSVEGFASNKIDSVIESSAFDECNIKKGDIILRMEGEMYSAKIRSYRDAAMFISINGENEAKITFERNGKKFVKVVKPKYDKDEERAIYGFVPGNDRATPLNVIYYSFWQCVFVIKSVFLSLWWLIRGIVPASSMSGPVAIVNEIGNAARMGWQTVLSFAGFISVNLGVMNLLPIPALDGGRILFLIIEKIRGKKLKPEFEGMVNFVFFALLIILMILVTFSDISKLV